MRSNSIIVKTLDIDIPLIQAPMAGGVTTPELVAVVSNAGGLGSFAAGYMAAADIRKSIQHIRGLTKKPFAVNLFIPEKHSATTNQIEHARDAVQASCGELNFQVPTVTPPYAQSFDEQMSVILEEGVEVFSFTFGIPSDEWLQTFKNAGIKLIGTATTLDEAILLETRGIDIIVAQGGEAGGHRGTFIGKAEDALTDLANLIPSIVDRVGVPVAAAGGIMCANDILAAMTLGASGVQMGTAFLCCPESGTHPFYKKLLLNASRDNTVVTKAFSGKLARGINNKFISRMLAHEDVILDYPIQNSLTSEMRREAIKQNNTDFMSMWAGQKYFLCKEISANELIRELRPVF